ncbi:MAG TPA: enoyl-CoA hydratase-related protein [Candidatus Binataceae bacterium]|nr:enoyl-CoA hydratase-related protein [Candidatus Binataceae bacterium]
MSGEIVRYQLRYPAAIITLDSPQTRNALSIAMVEALDAAIERADKDPRVRAIIFTAEGPAFCAGMDLQELRAALAPDHDGAWTGALRGEQLIDRIYRLSTPTIAAVNGVAAGGGAGLLSACDMAVAAPEARIGYPEMKVGIQSAMVLLHLMRLVGERQARYLALTGELIPAMRAREMGLINEVVPKDQLIATALQWAGLVAMNEPKAEALSKTLLRKFSTQAAAMTASDYGETPALTDDCRAGLEAFFAKRPVPWAPR